METTKATTLSSVTIKIFIKHIKKNTQKRKKKNRREKKILGTQWNINMMLSTFDEETRTAAVECTLGPIFTLSEHIEFFCHMKIFFPPIFGLCFFFLFFFYSILAIFFSSSQFHSFFQKKIFLFFLKKKKSTIFCYPLPHYLPYKMEKTRAKSFSGFIVFY